MEKKKSDNFIENFNTLPHEVKVLFIVCLITVINLGLVGSSILISEYQPVLEFIHFVVNPQSNYSFENNNMVASWDLPITSRKNESISLREQ